MDVDAAFAVDKDVAAAMVGERCIRLNRAAEHESSHEYPPSQAREYPTAPIRA